jgi:excisionase family DNA binding protein
VEFSKLLTVSSLAERWGRHPKTIYAQVAAHEIPFVRLGARAIRFRLVDIERIEDEALVEARATS